MLRLSDNPPILSTNVNSLTEFPGTWWVAHTKARFEKVFAWDMLKRNVGYFLPMQEKITFSGGRKRRVMLPLFTSYVFFCGTEEDRYFAMTTNRLCKTIEVIDQDVLISELAAIERILFNKTTLYLYPTPPVGHRCRISRGPMQGVEGVVVERKMSNACIVLEVAILGQGGLLEIDADLLELLE